ncbi:hypothetical protein [Nocardioides szechwanensis]|uniref:hypothetical protein n=1 Tax=Nocardioides szechwanensis TaxID=1005944 RepID=UPI000B874498|nr:hypothetical protein [Nocardioides szechwanensis]
MRGRRSALVAAGVLVLVAGGAGVAIARSTPSLEAVGPTSVSGTEATAVFEVGDRTVRQIRYDDGGTLRYTFRLENDGPLPVTVLGLDEEQADPRLFTFVGLTEQTIGAGESADLTLAMSMGGCETLSSRSGSFVSTIAVRTQQAGLFEDVVVLALPEEVHTGSPREAFCPNSTATSRPQG